MFCIVYGIDTRQVWLAVLRLEERHVYEGENALHQGLQFSQLYNV